MFLMSPWPALAQPYAETLHFCFLCLRCTTLPLCVLPVTTTNIGGRLGLRVISRVEESPFSSDAQTLRELSFLNGCFAFCFLFSLGICFWSISITQPSNSHACDLTPLAANVFPGAELAWFREDGNFNLPSIIFSIITPSTAISLHPESREGVERLKKEGTVHPVPNFNMSRAKKKRGCLYIIRGLL